MKRERHAYTCPKCNRRTFLPSKPERPPRCEQHGVMLRQPNKTYRGTKPLR